MRTGWMVVCSALLAFCTTTATAQEWTRFRGPNGSGISEAKTVPATWTEKDFNFRVELPASGHSSPVLWGDIVFLSGADDNKTAERKIFAVSAKTGEILWTKDFSSKFHARHKLNSFAAATPACDAERAYFCWSTPEEYTLLAVSHDGEEVWKQDLGPFISQHSCGASPIVYGDLVVLVNGQDIENKGNPDKPGVSSVVAVNAKTGKIAWNLPRDSAVVPYSTPCVRKRSDGKDELVFNSTSHGMTAVDPLTGKVNWELKGLLDKRSVSSPVLLGNGLITISCGSGAGGNYLLAMRPGENSSTADDHTAYKVDKTAPYVPTPIAYKDRLFLWTDNGIVMSLDATTGQEIWKERVGGTYYGSPICVDGLLYCANTDGEMVVVRAANEFELVGRNPLGEFSHSTPAVAQGKLFVRTYNHLISLGGAK